MRKEVSIHEASLADNLLQIVAQAAADNHLSRVTGITLQVGEFSGVVVESLEFAYGILSKGTVAEGAELEIVPVPLLLYCRECEDAYPAALDDLRCPACLGEAFEILQGRELAVASICGE